MAWYLPWHTRARLSESRDAGANHAGQVLEILAEVPGEAAQEVRALTLGMTVDKLAAILRKTAPPEAIAFFSALIRAAYGARLAFRMWPAEGRA